MGCCAFLVLPAIALLFTIIRFAAAATLDCLIANFGACENIPGGARLK